MMMEIQRSPGRGDGTYQNPILGGDYPDPALCRVNDDYYMLHSSFVYTPGLFLWTSKDLVNWKPIGSPLTKSYPRIFGSEIVHYKNHFYIYFPSFGRIFVTAAENPRGTWSTPRWTGLLGIDPGHIADLDGNRYLYVNHGKVAPLAADGLKATGKLQKVYDGWHVPRDWIIEGEALEGPKLFFKRPYYFLLNAMGGTAGPATSHMVIVARSNTPIGPWENSPYNPVLHTSDGAEKWWSQGHGTMLDTPDGDWWMMYHGYEKGYHTLGRQTLLVPISWTEDGWPILKPGIDPAKPIQKPGGMDIVHGQELSDTFQLSTLGNQWRFFNHASKWTGLVYTPPILKDVKVGGGSLKLKARGTSPRDGRLLLCIPVDHAYEISARVDQDGGNEAGLVLYYSPQCFTGIAIQKNHRVHFYRKGSSWSQQDPKMIKMVPRYLKIRNMQHEVIFFCSEDGDSWHMFQHGVDVSGYHHNVFGGFLSLRAGLYASGKGWVTFRDFKYTPIMPRL
jgi:xylan 1,4-beta-xylosidase